jgi:hypothetical protein
MAEFNYEIVKTFGELSESKTGWKKEVALVSWNDREAKYDIRDWAPELLDIFSGKQMHYFYPTGDEVYNVAAVYTCSDYSGEITPDHIECDVAEYFNPFDLPENITGFVRIIVECYREKYPERDRI